MVELLQDHFPLDILSAQTTGVFRFAPCLAHRRASGRLLEGADIHRADNKRTVTFVDGRNPFHAVHDGFGRSWPDNNSLALCRLVCLLRSRDLAGILLYSRFPMRWRTPSGFSSELTSRQCSVVRESAYIPDPHGIAIASPIAGGTQSVFSQPIIGNRDDENTKAILFDGCRQQYQR